MDAWVSACSYGQLRLDLETKASPQQVRRALTDFTDRRLQIWNRTLDPRTYELRNHGDNGALARESTREISSTHGPNAPGFLGSTVYEVLDAPDGLVEIADWESAEAQAAAVEQASTAGIYAPLMEVVAAPFKATRIGQLS